MNDNYKINGCEHSMHDNQLFLKDANYFPEFQTELNNFKNLINTLVSQNISKTFVHFGDGDYYFLKKIPIGSAKPGNRALSIGYKNFNIQPYREGWLKNDYHCVEYLECGNKDKLNELFPNLNTIPTEFLYGLTMNKWFLKTFQNKISLIGGHNKIQLIKKLMDNKEYQNYLGLEKFNDYITIPEKFACDNLENTINLVKTQLEQCSSETRIFLFGVGHVKSGLVHHFTKFKNAIYLDIGAGIDAIAGLIDQDRPYANNWTNYRLKDHNYNNIDLLNYDVNIDKNIKWI